jgi:hypothetical protein
MRTTKVALALAVFFLMTSASFAQAPWWGQRDRGWGYQNDRDRREYDHGYRDGANDREHGRSWHPRHNERDYMNGYRAGFGRNGGGWQGRRNDHDGDEGYRGGNNGGPYGNYPYGGRGGDNAQSVAYNNGYQEGLSYGERDRSSGRRSTPVDSGVYHDATRGYNPAYGDRTAYRLAFRQGYVAGYQRGYNGGGRRY